MIDAVLERKQAAPAVRFTVKALITAGILALAVVLPQLFHLAAGAGAGMRFLPMYLPVLLGGCLLGVRFGAAAGLLSPLVSYLVTSASGNAMPALGRLPFMMAELAVFALVAGLFASWIDRTPLMAFPAVWLAQLSGRAVFLASVAVFRSVAPLTPAQALAQIGTGAVGLAVQAVFVPLLVIALRALLHREARS